MRLALKYEVLFNAKYHPVVGAWCDPWEADEHFYRGGSVLTRNLLIDKKFYYYLPKCPIHSYFYGKKIPQRIRYFLRNEVLFGTQHSIIATCNIHHSKQLILIVTF